MKKVTKKKLVIGAGIAAVAAAAAGAYFLTSTKKGKKVSQKIAGWVGKAEKEVVAEMKKLKDVSQKTYEKAVDEVAKRYKTAKNIDAKDVAEFSKDLKSHWKGIQKEIEKKITPKKSVAKKKPVTKKK